MNLTKITETTSTITLGWTPPAGIGGYVFYANGVAVSTGSPNLKGGVPRKEIKFSKTDPGPPFQVAAVCRQSGILILDVGTYSETPPPPPPPPPPDEWPASFYTGPAGANILLPTKQGTWLGTAQSPYNGKSPEQQMTELEAYIGRKLDLEHRFVQSPNACTPLDVGLINAIVQRGRIPYISWNPSYRCDEIIRGDADACLRQFGAAVAAQPHRFIWRPYSEFDGNWRNFSKNSDGSMATTSQFVQMWKRSIDKAREGGAFPKASVYICSSHGYYARPVWINAQQAIADIGQSYYDWVGVDGYGGDTRTYAQINGLVECEQDFRGKKPVMHGETSAKEKAGDPNWKGNWWRGLRDTVKASMPGLLAVAVFDVAYTDGNWRIDTSEASKQGFRDLARDAHFNIRS